MHMDLNSTVGQSRYKTDGFSSGDTHLGLKISIKYMILGAYLSLYNLPQSVLDYSMSASLT